MPFHFRRGLKGLYKRIAHGPVPAATTATTPAVPRTPPPRSPNPSPERPRSALSAAILVTTLAGQTVAIPQPRQQSFSESLQDQENCIEPYATVTELRMGPNWKSDGDGQNGVQTLKTSGSCCENEDMDTYTSAPHRTRQESFLESSSANDEGDSTVCDEYSICPNVQVEEIEHPGVNFKEGTSTENSLNEKPPSFSDAVFLGRREQMVLLREKFQKLKEQNWHLNNTNQTLCSELKQTKQFMKEFELKIKKLEKENRQFTEKQKSHIAESAELVSLRQQAQELVEDNDSFKTTVHRLSVELSRYQSKYRPISLNENGSLPMKKPIPPWLLDMRYLSPLLLAYEDAIREKQNLILEHEENMKAFKARVEVVVTENEQLRQKLSKNTITTKDWQHLRSQAELLIEENKILLEKLKIEESKRTDTVNQHVKEVSKLKKQLSIMETEKQNQEVEMKDCKKKLEKLRSAYEALKASVSDCITTEERNALENKFKNRLQMEQEKRETETEELMKKLASVQAERKSLLLQKNQLEAENKVLESELEMAQKFKRRSRKKIDFLQQHVEETMEKEMTSHQHLVNMINLSETVTQERDQLLNLASSLEKEKDGVLTEVIEGNVRLGRLEEKVKIYIPTVSRHDCFQVIVQKDAGVYHALVGEHLQHLAPNGRSAALTKKADLPISPWT